MPTSRPPNGGFRGKRSNQLWLAAKLVALVSALVFLNQIGHWLADRVAFQLWPRHAEAFLPFLVIAVATYVFLLSIPFLPGIEMGLMLMSMLGAPGILLVYLATLLALSIGFWLGRLIPPRILEQVLKWFHLGRARELVVALEPLGPEERINYLVGSAPSRMVPFLLRHRYLMVALLFNLPGNALVGGGGGVSLIAGMSRLFPFPRYLLLITVATTPGPLFFLLRAK